MTTNGQRRKAAGHAAGRAVTNKIDQKIAEVEKENVGVEAWHKGEQALSRGTERVTRSAFRFVKERPYKRVAKLEKKATKANIKLSYRQALNDNPKLKSNILSRMLQKQKIKREYAKAAREAAKKSAKAAKKTGTVVGNIAKTAVAVVKRHPVVFSGIGLILFVVFFFSSLVTSCSNMGTGGIGAIFASSYLMATLPFAHVRVMLVHMNDRRKNVFRPNLLFDKIKGALKILSGVSRRMLLKKLRTGSDDGINKLHAVLSHLAFWIFLLRFLNTRLNFTVIF